jgi:hypothetical protein
MMVLLKSGLVHGFVYMALFTLLLSYFGNEFCLAGRYAMCLRQRKKYCNMKP